MTTNVLLVFTNCPDEQVAAAIAEALVVGGLAACVNRAAPVHSTYRWNGAVETSVEVPLLIKCTIDRYAEVESTIRQLHPYTTPEIVAVPVVQGLRAYLRWVEDETRPPMLA
jgi:periplasmic divalent cation tolerance protein